jgi:hypothetical protein
MDYFEFADKVLTFITQTAFREAGNPFRYIHSGYETKHGKTDLGEFLAVLEGLTEDGFLRKSKGINDVTDYWLTLKGRIFQKRGGYVGKYNEDESLSKLNKDQLKSVINTNRITWINVGVTILLTVVIVWLQYRADTREELREKREIHKELQEEKDRLEQSKYNLLYEKARLRKLEEAESVSKDSASHDSTAFNAGKP